LDWNCFAVCAALSLGTCWSPNSDDSVAVMAHDNRSLKARFDPLSYEATPFSTNRGGQVISERELSDIVGFLDQNSTILEVGTGPGRMTRRMAEELSARIVGIDADPLMIKHLRRQIHKSNSLAAVAIDLVVASGQDLPFKEAVFDKVVCIRVIRYFEYPKKAIAGMISSVRPGGGLILEFANILRPQSVAQLPQYLLRKELYPRLFRKREVENLLTDLGVRIIRIRGWHKIPPMIVASNNSAIIVLILSYLEKALQRILPVELMSRSIVVQATKG
jgi:SAM-dependent methyltransferase